ncbi:MAG: hypothetical protein WCK28_03600 [Burkholderiales bacterium]|jgi:hypothetical protein
MTDIPHDEAARARGWAAVGDWYHAAFTGLLLAVIVHRGTPTAARLVERVFAVQREARFLPGLAKLGLDGLPHAVACAAYHYLSNDVGGVAVEFMPESDRKAWVRYLPPRWIWAGTALCAVPDEVTVAMLRGWHAQNGTMLGNPRLGFVCTKTTTAGDAALEGYYLEHDRALEPHERLRFARDEDGPAFDPALAPALPSSGWPPERLARAKRNYAMEYLRTALPVAAAELGEAGLAEIVRRAMRQVGMQHHREACATLGLADSGDARSFAEVLVAMAAGQGDAPVLHAGPGDGWTVAQPGWRLLGDAPGGTDAVLAAWGGLWEGAAAAHDRRLGLDLRREGAGLAWTVSPPRAGLSRPA